MINFTVRLADRNAKQAEANFHIAQQQLADLAGVDAIAKLEDQVAQEQTALHNLVGKPDVLVPPLALPSVKSAQGKQ